MTTLVKMSFFSATMPPIYRSIQGCLHASFSLCILLSLMVVTPTNAQEYLLDRTRINIDNGLLSNEINSIIEDRNGLIWIGTKKGLQRYDGTEFTTWTPQNAPNLFLGGMQLVEDAHGWIWIKGVQEVVFLDPDTDEIIKFSERFPSTPEVNGKLTRKELLDYIIRGPIYQNVELQRLYFSDRDGRILTFDFKDGFKVHQLENLQEAVLVGVEADGSFWIQQNDHISDGKLFHFNREFEELESFTIPARLFPSDIMQFGDQHYVNLRASSLGDNSLSGIYLLSNGKLSRGVRSPKKGFDRVRIIEGKMWYRYENELIITELESEEILLVEEMDRSTLNRNIAMQDSRGITWLSDNNGLEMTQLKPNNFRTYCSFESENKKEYENAARGIVEHDKGLIVNFEHSFTGVIDTSISNSLVSGLDNNTGFYPRALFLSSEGMLLVGKADGIDVYNEALKKVEQIGFSTTADKAEIWAINQDGTGQLWVGGHTGSSLYKVDKQHELVSWRPNQGDLGFENYTLIQNIIPNNNGNFWLCTNTGLYEFSWQQERILNHYSSMDGSENYLPASDYYFVHESSSGQIWIGTNNGLIKMKPKVEKDSKLEFEVFDKAQGFPSKVIYSIFEDAHEKLWMSTDHGIVSFDIKSNSVRAYDMTDGISQMEFNRLSYFQANDGTVYFGGLNGVTSFHPDEFFQNDVGGNDLFISELDVFNGAQGELVSKLSDVRKEARFTFDPSDRYFRLKFTTPFYKNTNTKLYGWKLEGVDQDWNFQKENHLQFGMLPYGENVLRVKAMNPHGGWSKNELAITIDVIKPFYLRTGYIVLGLLTLIGLTALFFRYRNIRLKREVVKATAQIQKDKEIIEFQTQELKKLDELKSRFFANVSHELRTPLSLMMGPISSLLTKDHSKEDRQLLEFVNRNSQRLSDIVNEILDLSKLENNKMELDEETVDFYDYLNNYVKQFYSIGSSDSVLFKYKPVSQKNLKIYLDKNKFEKILNNFLSNALKFTNVDGEVSLNVEDFDDSIQIMIEDNGRGISKEDLPLIFDRFYQSKDTNLPAEGGTGIGLSMCRELSQIMGGKVWAESTVGGGSKFYFRFPFRLSDESLDIDESLDLEDSQSPQPSSTVKGARILVVEDNEDLREYYKIILADYQIYTAGHGKEALEMLGKMDLLPDLIVSDLMMPVMDGLQLIDRLKSDNAWRSIPVVMLTAKTNKSEKIKALRYGIDDYITKPFDEDELRTRIANLLANHYVRKDIAEETKDSSDEKFISKEDSDWLASFESYILANLSKDDLTVINLSYEFGMSERTLLRQLKRLTGLSTVKYLQEHKLNTARAFLESGEFKTVAEVAHKIGFRDPKTFTRSFKQRFGSSPSAHMHKL